MGSSNSSVSYSTTCVPINQTELIIFYAIQGVYGSLSIALYIMNIRALMNRRNPLDKVFCKLYITSAVLSTVYFLFHYCIQRFSNVGFFCRQLLEIFAEPTWVLNPYKSVATYCPVAILVIHFAISFNRLTVVLFPVSASLVWADHFYKILVILLLIPLVFVWYILPCKSYAALDTDGGVEIEYKKVFKLSSALHTFIAATLFGSLTLLATAAVAVKIYQLGAKQLSSAEKTLFAFEALLMLTTMLYAVTQAMLYASKYLFESPSMQSTVLFFRNFIIDIFILPNAWTLPLLSTSVRRYYASK
ncbi:unnamed protein product, partial [Nippostrongylus brasiliensis]|uniref:Serpentine receptor class gamma n=1 Tax=Nippostrongylus brasiliensis TaxID=27835 RepID=A0A0N4YU94_NIPBR